MKMKKRAVITVILGIIVLVVLIIAVNNSIIKLPIENVVNETCQSDSDCIIQQVGCCPCSMGGEETCMTKSASLKKQEELAKCSKGIMCLALYACQNISCQCANGTCQNK
jgi:hypothetical protein